MEEVKQMTKDGKVFTAFIVESIRDAVNIVHENKIQREDLIAILKDREEYVVFCYK